MKTIKVDVSLEPEEFYLSYKTGWAPKKGHRIQVGEFDFSAVPIDGQIKFSEVHSGAMLFETPFPEDTDSFVETMNFLHVTAVMKIGALIQEIGEEEFSELVRHKTEESLREHGPKPGESVLLN